jgi:hypothetical protein
MKKRRVTLNLDEDIVEALKETDSPSLSAAANTARRESVDVELHRRALREWLGELYEQHGPPSPEDFAAAETVLDEAMGRANGPVTQRRGAA